MFWSLLLLSILFMIVTCSQVCTITVLLADFNASAFLAKVMELNSRKAKKKSIMLLIFNRNIQINNNLVNYIDFRWGFSIDMASLTVFNNRD